MDNKLELDTWETKFSDIFQYIGIPERQNTGALLRIIPSRERWDEFVATVKKEWRYWRRNLVKYPYSLITLYDGVAFYEYEDNTFWPRFSKAIGGGGKLSPDRQTEINSSFQEVANDLGLRILSRDNGINFVGSAIYHIGIPLSLWDDFLEICEWAIWQVDWKTLTDLEWLESIEKRAGRLPRLKKFLIDNREVASAVIQEMLEARRKFTETPSLNFRDLIKTTHLRPEYFEEVPETADFLRPYNPESLVQDRARLIWNEQLGRISLQLPAVSIEKLPAIWTIGDHISQKAASTPDELILNSAVFNTSLILKLKSEKRYEMQRLRGLVPWGLFDLEKGTLSNPNRRYLPIRGYMLISPERLEGISQKGFEVGENPVNEEYKLEDGTKCYITRLWPTGRRAEISFITKGAEKKLTFYSRAKVETRLFVGEGAYAANFRLYRKEMDRIIIERSPLPCVSIPIDYFQDVESTLGSKFFIYIDEILARGNWKKGHTDEERVFYFWHPSPDFRFSDFEGKRILSIRAPEFGLKFEYKIQLEKQKPKIDKSLERLPGDFIIWFLLCQPSSISDNHGAKWEDLLLAKGAIDPKQQISYYLLHKYAYRGLLMQHGRYWVIAESRAVLELTDSGELVMLFCGNPSIIWGLFRYMHDHVVELPTIEIINKRGEMPFLFMRWNKNQKENIVKYLNRHYVCIVSDLWAGK